MSAVIIPESVMVCDTCGHRHGGRCAHWGCDCWQPLPVGVASVCELGEPHGPRVGERDQRLRFVRDLQRRMRCGYCGNVVNSWHCRKHAVSCWYGRAS